MDIISSIPCFCSPSASKIVVYGHCDFAVFVTLRGGGGGGGACHNITVGAQEVGLLWCV